MKMNHRFLIATLLTVGLLLIDAPARAGLMDIFRSDLAFTLVVDRADGLRTGDPVEFENADGRREVIGRIDAIPDPGGGDPVVSIRIEARHKERVRAGSRVVLDRPWMGDGAARIYIVTPEEARDTEPMRSGAVVQARTPAAEKAERMAGQVQILMEQLLDRSRQYLDRLKTEIDGGQWDRFMDQLEDTARTVERYSREQKERFSKEILPELERLMESARQRFRENPDPQREEKMEREYKRLKEELSV
jgi:ABC-type transporter Mla subunit MlaD